MKECPHCGVILSPGQKECAFCGALQARQHAPVAEEEVDRLLAEANLLRIRKQSDDAISLCTKILRMDPQNATAHALMGDIHRDEGNFREALGWFKLATQLDPNNSTDRKKLDEMIDRVFRNAAEGGDEVSEHAMAAGKSDKFADQARAILEKVTPVHVVIAFSLVAVLVFVVLVNIGKTPAKTPVSPGPTVPPVVQPASDTTNPANPTQQVTPTVMPPTPDTAEDPRVTGLPGLHVVPSGNANADTPASSESLTAPTPAPESKPAQAAPGQAVTSVPPFEPIGRTVMTAEEVQKQTDDLRTALETALKDSKFQSKLDEVQIDPRTRTATIWYEIPHMQGPVETKQGLLYTGFKLIWAADRTISTLKSYEIRGYAFADNGNAPSLALIADVSPQQADDAREAADYRAVSKYMSSTWWRSDLDTAQL